MPNPFCRYELRTTDLEGARAFYARMFGSEFWSGTSDEAGTSEDGPLRLTALPAAAAARGAPPYWLGHIGVEDVMPPMYRFLEAGATRLGALPSDGRDSSGVVLRDPFGAIVALTPANIDPPEARVAWHLHGSRDEEAAFGLYAEIFGWTAIDRHDLGERGRHVTFSWDRTGGPAGSAGDVARRPHVHSFGLYERRQAGPAVIGTRA